jgi:hypothetical protein
VKARVSQYPVTVEMSLRERGRPQFIQREDRFRKIQPGGISVLKPTDKRLKTQRPVQCERGLPGHDRRVPCREEEANQVGRMIGVEVGQENMFQGLERESRPDHLPEGPRTDVEKDRPSVHQNGE